MKVIDLLNKIANGEEVPRKFTYKGYLWEYDVKSEMWFYYFEEGKNHRFDRLFYLNKCLNDEVGILEEEKELHANDIEFNINVDKRDCVITLDENDLGIDKLHLENCYFYKENDKWYVKKYDFKNFNLEEKKIPEKLKSLNNVGNSSGIGEFKDKQQLNNHLIKDKLNEVINYLDYLKSKGDE